MKNNNTNRLIKEKSKALFFSYGLKSVSMNDIAQLSGISKKTIYQSFDDKNALVYAVVNDLIRSHEDVFKIAQATAKDAIDEVIKQDTAFSSVCTGLRPSFFYELENFFPDVWEVLQQYKLKIHKGIIVNLRRGQEKGDYREDIDRKLISDLRLHQLVNVLKPEFLTSFDLSVKQLADQFTMLYLRAITTEKGKKLLDRYLNDRTN